MNETRDIKELLNLIIPLESEIRELQKLQDSNLERVIANQDIPNQEILMESLKKEYMERYQHLEELEKKCDNYKFIIRQEILCTYCQHFNIGNQFYDLGEYTVTLKDDIFTIKYGDYKLIGDVYYDCDYFVD